jgi:uncharacterized protein YyaL (SSP411 family)
MKSSASEAPDPKHNNLDKSSSPYLLQHTNNPVWWQEWSDEVIKLAVESNKPVFVSVGYSTCHWCHVMASEAFSDNRTAAYLNSNFICIKIDREQRPDIDQYMMHFINSQSGRGGWPLNVFLTPDLKPFFALTYAPLLTNGRSLSFLDIAEKVHEYYVTQSESITPFVYREEVPPVTVKESLVSELSSYFDSEYGGFGTGQKFPPHSTLLYLLYHLSVDEDQEIREICTKTLEAIRMRGLNDHLQGGIYRYCVDREWTIPHFEKMLYDQAMALWCYSVAYKVLEEAEYKIMAEKILVCLNECFEHDGLYISAFDADTEHEEGATYLWSMEELKTILDEEEYRLFYDAYNISKEGNFEGLNHLIKRSDNSPDNVERKLLVVRNKRKQPSRDDKVISGINSLVVIAKLQAGRCLNNPSLEDKAASVMRNIINKFWDGLSLGHSYYNGTFQKQGFLSDAGATLTAISMLCEKDSSWNDLMLRMAGYVKSFKKEGKWIESESEDFQTVDASWFDHPVPSSVSLAEMGLTRAAILSSEETKSVDYRRPFQSDFYNINALLNNGLFHIFTGKKLIPWDNIPVNSVQLRGDVESDCYMGTCRFYS